jgi:hypothetical protein
MVCALDVGIHGDGIVVYLVILNQSVLRTPILDGPKRRKPQRSQKGSKLIYM